MSTVEKWVPAIPEDVWAILADPRSYAFWVVGSHDVTGFDGEWPAPGATFSHVQGQGPFKLSDTTTVVEAHPPHKLVLDVRARPVVAGPVTVVLAPEGEGTLIKLTEVAERGLAGFVPNLLTDPLLSFRNADSLRRLAAMAWARAASRHPVPTTTGS